jgi:hypothetical protein
MAIVGAVVSAGASLAGSVLSSGAASDAADAQAAAADKASAAQLKAQQETLALQQAMYNKNLELNKSSLLAGNTARDQYMNLLGLSPSQGQIAAVNALTQGVNYKQLMNADNNTTNTNTNTTSNPTTDANNQANWQYYSQGGDSGQEYYVNSKTGERMDPSSYNNAISSGQINNNPATTTNATDTTKTDKTTNPADTTAYIHSSAGMTDLQKEIFNNYVTKLGRDPDQAGFDYWTQQAADQHLTGDALLKVMAGGVQKDSADYKYLQTLANSKSGGNGANTKNTGLYAPGNGFKYAAGPYVPQVYTAPDKFAYAGGEYKPEKFTPDVYHAPDKFTFKDFSYDQYTDPGTAFRLSEGLKGVNASAAARGGALSGNALRAITDYGQKSASQEYANAYSRYNQDYGNAANVYNMNANVGLNAFNTNATNKYNAFNMNANNNYNAYNMNYNNASNAYNTYNQNAYNAFVANSNNAANAYNMNYNNSYNNYNTTRANDLNSLSVLMGAGQQTANTMNANNNSAALNGGNVIQQTANNVANNTIGAGNALAAGTMASSNAWNTGISNAGKNLMSAFNSYNNANDGYNGGAGGMNSNGTYNVGDTSWLNNGGYTYSGGNWTPV